MIRILITAILYLISFFTQAQTDSNNKYDTEITEKRVAADNYIKDSSCNTIPLKNLDSTRNKGSKFEVTDKHLTFEIK